MHTHCVGTLPHFLHPDAAPDRATTYPSLVDHDGQHISFHLSSHLLPTKREARPDRSQRLYYKVEAFGKSYILNVSNSAPFVSSDHVIEFHGSSDGNKIERQPPRYPDCHYTGDLVEESDETQEGWVAISNCRGLVRAIGCTDE